MADWFKLHENWFTEPRLQWAIKEQQSVVQVWLWVLTECCRTKSDTIGLHSEDYEMIGIQQLLNISPGLFNQGINLLEKIKYIEINTCKKTIKALKWNDFQSDYLMKKSRRESDSVRQSPTKSDSVRLEERRIEENRIEEAADAAITKKSYKPPSKLVYQWARAYMEFFGAEYLVSKGKDEKAAQSLMGLRGVSYEEIIDIAKKAWAHNGFNSKQALSLSGFASRFNEIRSEVGELNGKPQIQLRPSL